MGCKLNAIVAVCDDWGIGIDGGMVVKNRADMRHFVRMTTGHPVIMGRRTLESFPGGQAAQEPPQHRAHPRSRVRSRRGRGRPSPRRGNRSRRGEDEAWVIGGAQVYRQMLGGCSGAVVTRNHCIRPADSFFPDLDADPDWELVEQTEPEPIVPGEGDAGVSYSFATYRHRMLG